MAGQALRGLADPHEPVAERLVLRSYLERLLEARNREIAIKTVAESDIWRQFVPQA